MPGEKESSSGDESAWFFHDGHDGHARYQQILQARSSCPRWKGLAHALPIFGDDGPPILL